MNFLLSDSSPHASKKCHNCGSELLQDAVYCHKCGVTVLGNNDNNNNIPSLAESKRQDYSNVGLLIIKIGAILAFVLPFASLAGISGVAMNFNGRLFDVWNSFFLGAFIAIIVIGAIFGIIALKFHKDIIAGRSERIVHTIILGVVMFVLGSNVAGALVGIGAFLCYISPSINKSRHP